MPDSDFSALSTDERQAFLREKGPDARKLFYDQWKSKRSHTNDVDTPIRKSSKPNWRNTPEDRQDSITTRRMPIVLNEYDLWLPGTPATTNTENNIDQILRSVPTDTPANTSNNIMRSDHSNTTLQNDIQRGEQNHTVIKPGKSTPTIAIKEGDH
jgi:hypothetical protein